MLAVEEINKQGGYIMAWCPKCNGNYPIVVSVEGSSYSVPIITERYNRWGEYIGYEESKTLSTDIETLPRCSNCYSVLEFPNATSKEEYFFAKRSWLIQRCRDKLPSIIDWEEIGGTLILSGLICLVIWVILQVFLAAGPMANPIVTKAVVGLYIVGSIVIIVLLIISHKEDQKKVREKIDQLQAMEYSNENYERLRIIRDCEL